MKIKSLTLQNYKKFTSKKHISFCDSDGEVNDVTLILGNNGSGKSSILQAITLLLASVIREKFSPNTLDWSGFNYQYLQTGTLPPTVEASIIFSEEELKATTQFATDLQSKGIKLDIPSCKSEVNLTLDYEDVKVKAIEGAKASFQFSGHQYAKRLSQFTSNTASLFKNVGNIYWYNEQRNSYSLSNLLDSEVAQLDFIRSFLASTYSYHLAVTEKGREIRQGEFDFYEKLETLYKLIFPNRSFVGVAPNFNLFEEAKAPSFFLSDGKNQYELSGMSAGERAIFPILMDFARWNINNSIIIIDEIELHLHPPLQQALIRTLPKLGKNNQFIITSHSNSVASMFNEEENQIIRLSNE